MAFHLEKCICWRICTHMLNAHKDIVLCFFIIYWLLVCSQVFMNLKFYFFNMCLLHLGDKKNMKLSLLNYLSLLLEWLWRLILSIWFLPPPSSFFKCTQAISSVSFCQTQYISFFYTREIKDRYLCRVFFMCHIK